ncbi:hypothetical protein CJJ23_02955 [Mycoplasmopsis agassizii]|uniref:Uncharacterized protein n=1 Tax=Mycoplasmopsis agassizii TaxID=33922 RepID=A0A269TIH7_9BACT|nr:hypothetical protein [Mycoplasmopsis agassizii]PAK21282.1 hypothetical protein CJJ23_02955 [Mycoplasmopsis agassizii]
MATEKIKFERWYCTLRENDGKNPDIKWKNIWTLKKANENPTGEFEHQKDAVEHFKKLNLNANLWFQKGGKFVRTIKSVKSAKGHDQILIDSDDSKEEQERAKKLLQERERKLREELKAQESTWEAEKSELEKRLKKEEKENSKLTKEIQNVNSHTSTLERRLIESEKALQEEKARRSLAENELDLQKQQTQELLLKSKEQPWILTQEVEVVKEKIVKVEDSLATVLLNDEKEKVSELEEKLARERLSRMQAERQVEEIRQTQILDLSRLESEVQAHENTKSELEELRATREILIEHHEPQDHSSTTTIDDEQMQRLLRAEATLRELERRRAIKDRLDKSESLITVDDQTALIIIDEVEQEFPDDDEIIQRARHQKKIINERNYVRVENTRELISNNELQQLKENNAKPEEVVLARPDEGNQKIWGLKTKTWYMIAKTVFLLSLIALLIVLAIGLSSGFLA